MDIQQTPQAPLAVYDEFRAQLAEMKDQNEKLVFDYSDPAGNKEARSHVFKLRKSKAAVDKRRKEEKAQSLQYGRLVDSEAKEIITEIESMIEVHDKPLREIEQREKERVAAIEQAITQMSECANVQAGSTSSEIETTLAKLRAHKIDESYGEFEEEAARVQARSETKLATAFEAAKKREAEQAELEQLRKEKAERDEKERAERLAREQREREAEIKQQAAEQAKLEAEKRHQEELDRIAQEKLEAERAAEEKRLAEEAKAKAENERLEREAAEAKEKEEQAKRDAELAVLRERERVETERKAQEAAAAKREASKRHRTKIEKAVIAGMVESGLHEDKAIDLVVAINSGNIPHVSIQY